jgi:aminopeptidase N
MKHLNRISRYFILIIGVLLLHGSVFSISPVGQHYYLKHSYDVLKYSLDIDIYSCYKDPFPKAFRSTEIITLKVDSALNRIRLDAFNGSLQIDSVRMPAISFTHKNDTLSILLNRTYQPGEIITLKILYQHKDTADNAFYAGGGSVFLDLPAEGARRVFPCWDRPSDKALWELRARVPKSVRLASNGTLADSVITGDALVYHWISHDPMSTYLMTLSSHNGYLIDKKYWHRPGKAKDSIPALFYYRGSENPVPVEKMITPLTDYYSREFGPYPFEKIGFSTLNSLFQWGGMENQTLVNLQPGGWRDGLVAHEFSHMWFGDLITCATWADIWLNESFATYCESLWLEHTKGHKEYMEHLENQAETYLENNPGFPIYNPGWAIHTPPVNVIYTPSVIYDKGACVLHQLRCLLGDSLFFHVLHAYATDTNLMYKNALTSDFTGKVNALSGKDYSWFFNEWLDLPNHPVYKDTFEISKLKAGKWKVKFTVCQTQSYPNFFEMPIQVLIGFKDKSDTLIKVTNYANPQVFEFYFDKRPVTAVFDPDENILLKQESTAIIRKKDGDK